jgi:hypothetical protein
MTWRSGARQWLRQRFEAADHIAHRDHHAADGIHRGAADEPLGVE